MKTGTLYLIIINALFPFLIGCGEGAKGQQRTEITDPMNAYRSQEHRFEIRGCQLFYNDQHVVLDSIKTFERIMGDNYNSVDYIQNFYFDKPVEFYIKACKVSEGENRPCIGRLNILMSHKEGVRYDLSDSYDSIMSLRPALEGYILFDGVLVDANTRIEDLNRQLEANGKYTLGGALGMSNSPGISYTESACGINKNCDGLTFVSFYYYENTDGDIGTIQSFRYSFSCTR